MGMRNSGTKKREEEMDIPEINMGGYGCEGNQSDAYNRVRNQNRNPIIRQGHNRNSSMDIGDNLLE